MNQSKTISKQDISIDETHSVHITICQQKTGQYRITGYLATPDGTRYSKSSKTKTAKTDSEIEYQKRAVINALIASSAPAEKRKKKESNGTEKAKNGNTPLRRALFALGQSDSTFFPTWNEKTKNTCLTYFKNHTLTFLEQNDFLSISTQTVYDFLRHETTKNSRSSGIGAYVDTTAKRHLYEAVIIIAEARKIESDVPLYNIEIPKRKQFMFEQLKSMPEFVRQNLRRMVEERYIINPKLYRAAILMIDASLRTAEAAAVLPCDLLNINRQLLSVVVGFQEKEGKRSPRVKTDNGYRNVPMSFWGSSLVEKCNRLITAENVEDSPVRASDLSSLILVLLREAGMTDDVIDALLFLETYHPDTDENGRQYYDLSAYILRRDRATIYKTICGLTSEEIDYMLGHYNRKAKYAKVDLRLTEEQLRIAQNLERYVSNTHISLHPGIAPIELSANDDFVVPIFDNVVYRNNSEVALKIKLDVQSTEPGERIDIFLPSRLAEHKYQPRTTIRLEKQSEPIIGSNLWEGEEIHE